MYLRNADFMEYTSLSVCASVVQMFFSNGLAAFLPAFLSTLHKVANESTFSDNSLSAICVPHKNDYIIKKNKVLLNFANYFISNQS